MKVAILKIILWPKKPERKPRVIRFQPGKINVITGQSMSGKSSLSWIVDYCLGSSKCSIPVGIIRDNVEWFGLHLQLPDSQMLVARRNPGVQKSTDDYFLHEAVAVELDPERRPEKNSRRHDLVNRLNELAQLPLLSFDPGQTGEGYKARPSIRDLVAFCFLPQHIVANQYTLFYRTDTTEHRERLRTVIPLALGAISAKSLEQQRELADLQRELDRKQREFKASRAAVEAWQAGLKGHYAKARELGLATRDQDVSAWTTEDFLKALKAVIENAPQGGAPPLLPGTIERASTELAQLTNQEAYLSRELARLSRRMTQMQRVNVGTAEYQQQLGAQQDRMEGISWFEKLLTSTKVCPVCHSPTTSASENLHLLTHLSTEVRQRSTALAKAPPVIDKEMAELRTKARELEEQLNDLRKQRRALEGASKEQAGAPRPARGSSGPRRRARAPRCMQMEVFRFLGRLEQALETVAVAQPDASIARTIEALEEQVKRLKAALDPQRVRSRMDMAIRQIATRITHYAEQMGVERSGDHILLDTKELTLQFQRGGRGDWLWEIGSGQNWMGYHISALCALQEFFAEAPSPVPQFLMIDQPSQVFFPEAWPSAESDPVETASPEKREKVSADIEGVRRVFRTLADFMRRSKGRVQVIVTEHAGDITWRGIPEVHVVGNWRDGIEDFLIPRSWLVS